MTAGAEYSAADMGTRVSDKGLKGNAISFLSNVVIGLSSTSPAYSLAVTLGPIAGLAAFGTPAILLVAFFPMLMIVAACYHLNRAMPDCGTTFTWVTRTMGPYMGWMAGWSVIVTDIVVMPSLAKVSADYSLRLMDMDYHSYPILAAVIGVGWIAIMTAISYLRIEISARTQQLLLGVELAILAAFAIAALVKVHAGSAPFESPPVSFAWFNPLKTNGLNNFTEAVVLAIFIYWGWDAGIAFNEETKNPGTAPGRAAIVATIILVGIYVGVAVAAVAYAGPVTLSNNSEDALAALGDSVFGVGFGWVLTVAVLISALASAQTTILPTARMAVSMASAGAIPRRFGAIQPGFQSPGFATLVMGGVSIAWYVILICTSDDVLDESILALGLIIAFYYGLTAIACVIFYRHELFGSVRKFCVLGLIPGAGGLIMFALLIKTCLDLGKSGAGSMDVFGIGRPLVIGVGSLLAGVLLMAFARQGLPDFFNHRLGDVAEGVISESMEPPHV